MKQCFLLAILMALVGSAWAGQAKGRRPSSAPERHPAVIQAVSAE